MSVNSSPRTWVSGEVVTAAEMNAEIRDPFIGLQAARGVWVPTWTNFTPGNATIDARFTRYGKQVFASMRLTWGSTTSATGQLRFTLPVAPSVAGTGQVLIIGRASILDASGPTRFARNVTIDAGNTTATLSDDSFVTVSNTVPMTWAVGDTWGAEIGYEAA